MNWRKTLFLLLGFLAASACSRLDWAVRFADLYLLHEADRFIDLTSDQKKELKGPVQKLIKDIREQDFPKFADLIESIAGDLQQKGYSPANYDRWTLQTHATLDKSIDRFKPMTLQAARFASKDQELHFAKTIREAGEDSLRDIDTPKKSLKINRQRILKWTDDLIGNLTTAQNQDLDEFASQHPFPLDLQMKSRNKIVQEFIAVPGPTKESWLDRFFDDNESLQTPEYKQARKAWVEELKIYLGKLWSSLSEEQKKNLFENAKKKATEFRRLSSTN